jgi:splicing factor 3B subunit 5
MAADRYSFGKSFEYVQSKHVGTGHSDMSKFEWLTNQHRDTYASNIGHYDILSYMAVAQGDSIGRMRYQLLEVFCHLIFILYFAKELNNFKN